MEWKNRKSRKYCGTSQVVKNLPANAGDVRDVGSVPGLGRCPGGEYGNTLHYSCLENPRDRGAWWATLHGAAQLEMTEETQHTSTKHCEGMERET